MKYNQFFYLALFEKVQKAGQKLRSIVKAAHIVGKIDTTLQSIMQVEQRYKLLQQATRPSLIKVQF